MGPKLDTQAGEIQKYHQQIFITPDKERAPAILPSHRK